MLAQFSHITSWPININNALLYFFCLIWLFILIQFKFIFYIFVGLYGTTKTIVIFTVNTLFKGYKNKRITPPFFNPYYTWNLYVVLILLIMFLSFQDSLSMAYVLGSCWTVFLFDFNLLVIVYFKYMIFSLG